MTGFPNRVDDLRRSFWVLPGMAIVVGVVAGFGLVELDYALDLDPDLFTFVDVQSARAVLQTIATVTVSVAGLSFSVTLVALQLASQQLSPRVLRTFQGDRLVQCTLATFVGTFVYALVVLAKLTEQGVPALSMTVAIVGAVAAFALFVAFIHRIVDSLKASTLIARIADDGHRVISHRWPVETGSPGNGPAPVPAGPEQLVRARGAGYVTAIDGQALVEHAGRLDALIRQRAAIGGFVVTGTVLASVHGRADLHEDAEQAVRAAFELDDERSVVGDVGYPIRQLADVGLRALSPSLNDPTTAENAIGAITELLVQIAISGTPQPVRTDRDGVARLVAVVPELDDLVRLGFEQLRAAAADHPAVRSAIAEGIGAIGRMRGQPPSGAATNERTRHRTAST
jgi:uncharacterized membrane protein